MTAKLAWERVKEAGRQHERPGGRSGHTLTAMGPNVYMFGGLAEGSSPSGPTDEMWLLSMSSTDAEWHACAKQVDCTSSNKKTTLIVGCWICYQLATPRVDKSDCCDYKAYFVAKQRNKRSYNTSYDPLIPVLLIYYCNNATDQQHIKLHR